MLRAGTIGEESAYLHPSESLEISSTRWRGYMTKKTIALGFLILMVGNAGAAIAQDSKFAAKLVKSRSELRIGGGRMTGTGGDLLRSVLADAQYVLIGEDHGTSQIPMFTSAVCAILGPQGFHTMAVEAGPMAADIVQQGIGHDDRWQRIAASETKYPDSIAFFNLAEELDMVTSCAQSAKGETFHLWGLDQELMGSTGMTMARILDTHPQKEASAAAQHILDENNAAAEKAAKSGNPGELLMLSAPDEEFTQLNELLKKEGNTEAQRLMRGLIASRQIYKDNMAAPSDSNRERALLMKQTFMQDYDMAARGSRPKVLMKFGDWHLYKGFNPLQNNDIGNFITELADGQGTKALHIIILPVTGSRLRFAGIGRPYAPEGFKMLDDNDYKFMQPFVDGMGSEGWTVFDLRKLRGEAISDLNLQRLVSGYDLLVLIPEATAATQIR